MFLKMYLFTYVDLCMCPCAGGACLRPEEDVSLSLPISSIQETPLPKSGTCIFSQLGGKPASPLSPSGAGVAGV